MLPEASQGLTRRGVGVVRDAPWKLILHTSPTPQLTFCTLEGYRPSEGTIVLVNTIVSELNTNTHCGDNRQQPSSVVGGYQ